MTERWTPPSGPSSVPDAGAPAAPAAGDSPVTGLFEWDALGNGFRHCPVYPRLLGWQEGERPASGGELLGRLHPEDRERLGDLRRQLTPGAPTYSAVLRVRRPEGGEVVLEERGCGFFDEHGRLVRVVGTVVDRGAQREAERARRESELRLAGLVESALDAIIAVDEEQRIVLFNPAAERMFGYRAAQVLHRSLAQLLPEGLQERHAEHMQAFASSGLRSRSLTGLGRIRGRRASGEEFPIDASVSRAEVQGRTLFTAILRDITERARIEESLRRERSFLRTVIDAVPSMIFVKDREGRFLLANEALARCYGTTAEAMVGKTDADFNPDADEVAHFRRDDGEVIGTRQGKQIPEEKVTCADGQVRWFSTVKVPLIDADGRCDKVLGVATDISGLRQAEAALRDSERLYRAIGESIDYGVWVCTPDGRNTYASPSFLRLVGLTQEQCSNFGWGAALHPEDAERTIAAWKECVRTGGTWDIEHRFRGADGEWHDVLARGVPVRGERGEIVCWAGINLDISRLKRAEADVARLNRELQRRLAELQTIFNTVPIGLAIAEDPLCRHIRGNPANERLLGVPAGSELSRGAPDAPPFRVLQDGRELPPEALPMQRAGRGEVVTGQVFDVARADGTVITLYSSAAPLYDEEGRPRGAVGAFLDITEIRRAEQALREANRRKDEFLAMLAHELRNPLVPIRNAAHIMGLVDQAEPRLRWVRESIERQVTYLTRLVDDLLDLSRIVRGKIALKWEEVDIVACVHQAVETVRPLVQAKGHRLELRLPEPTPRVAGDPVRLSQVLLNLLDNAAKYTPEGGRIEVEAAVVGAELALAVRDNGMGIPAELLPRVFDLFEQGERTLDRARGGLGIGLTLVRRLVEQHGGRVEVQSPGPGLGAVFTVRLPVSGAVPAPSPPAGGASSPVSVPLRVLVVDDDRAVADSTALWLQLQGHEVRVAQSGAAALDQAQAFRPQIVLLDIGLSGMDGYETARRLRALPGGEGLCLVAVTGYGHDQARARARAAGFDHHLVKPVDPGELAAVFTRAATRTAPDTPSGRT